LATVAAFNLTPVKSTWVHSPHAIELRREGAIGDRRFLFGRLDGSDHVGPVGAETARRFACDGSVMRVVLSGPLDVGRRTPVASPAERRAVVVRDGGCRFPGCGRPHTWCDAHHVVHWADGGPTALSNLLLLCRRRHRMLHHYGDGRFRVTLVDGRPEFRRSDGALLENRAPP
jgi:hypothetical protein